MIKPYMHERAHRLSSKLKLMITLTLSAFFICGRVPDCKDTVTVTHL